MFFVIILTTILAVLAVRHYQKARKLPPGPFSLPLIGNIHQLAYHVWRQKGVVPAFDVFRKTYGDVFTLWLGPIPHVSIADFETSHEVFVKNGNKYKDRFNPEILDIVCDGHGLLMNNGANWEEMRKFTLHAFRNMGVGRDVMDERILTELNVRCAEIDARSVNGRTVVQTTELFDLTVGNVINSILIGKRFDDNNKGEFLKLKELIYSTADVFTIFDLTVPPWFLQKFFPRRYDLMIKSQVDVADYVSREAAERIEEVNAGRYTVNPEDPHDLVDAFIAKMEQEKKQNGTNTVYTLKSLKFVLSDLWQAGQDTTSTTMVSGFNHLVNHPEIVKKVREELMRVTNDGARPLSLQDRAETHYLNATIAEIQRHASILNVNFWKVSHEPTTVKGYTIDSGTLITAQLGALHVNEDIFKRPEEFNPDRFIKDEKLLTQVIPFGIGKRSCVGEQIARAELYMVIGNLLLRYDIQPHGSLPSTSDVFPYSSAKQPDKTVKLEFVRL